MPEKFLVVQTGPADNDEEGAEPARVLTEEEFFLRLRGRSDIFGIERNDRLRTAEIASLVVAAVTVFWFSSKKPAEKFLITDPPAIPTKAAEVSVGAFDIDRKTAQAFIHEPAKTRSLNERKMLRPARQKYGGHNAQTFGSGVGNIRARLSKIGVIGMVSGKISGRMASCGDPDAAGGFASSIDAVISGMKQGLARGGSGPMVRREAQCMGFGPGYGPSGFGGSSPGGVDEMIDNLLRSDPSETVLALKTSGRQPGRSGMIGLPDAGGRIAGSFRSRSEITRVVMQNIGALRYAYNRCLRGKPGIQGKITVRFVIDEFGNVIHCEVLSSSLGDEELAAIVKDKIQRWKFDRIDRPGDITEVVYPFLFST